MKFSSFCARLLRLSLFVATLVMLPSMVQGQVGTFVDCIKIDPSTIDPVTNSTDVTAFFGYSNFTGAAQVQPAGSGTNRMVPNPPVRGQPSTFLPGTHHYAFSVTLRGSDKDSHGVPSLTWFFQNAAVVVSLDSPRCLSQTFTYQGRLTDGSTAASGTYQMQFKLFDAATGSNQIGATVENNNVTVAGGVFTVPINVLSVTAFSGSDRFLEIWVKRPADASFTLLSPRQPITATPYALHSQSAAVAETAVNASLLGSNPVSSFVLSQDSRLTDSRAPTAGSSNYIQNTTSQQTAEFNISGNGTLGGTLAVGTLGTPGSTEVCLNSSNQIAGCSNRYSGTFTPTEPSTGVVVHNLGTLDVQISIYKSNGDGTWEYVNASPDVAIKLADANTVKVSYSVVGTYRILIWK